MQLKSFWIRTCASIGALTFAAGVAGADVVTLSAERDTILIEDPNGALANGSGPVLFVGRTNQGQNGGRRGLIYFDVDAALPANAIVDSVRLTLYMSPSNSAPRPIALHRALTEWGEGASYATGGSGDSSEPGDATWIHTFYDEDLWVKPGGHFVASASASRVVGASGFYTWEGAKHLVADVRTWLAAPHRNFGWILLGDETERGTVKRFASREAADSSLWPFLEVTYHLPGEWAGLDRTVDYGVASFASIDAWRKR